MNQEIKTLIDSWATETKARITQNLEKRKVVGQRWLVKKITFDLQTDGDQYTMICTFERQFQLFFPNGRTFKTEIHDPLFNRRKAWSRESREISFVRKANIFDHLKGRYWNELIEKVTAIDKDFATKMVIRTLSV